MNKFKKFLNMFNIFELNLTSRSYKSGAIRMAVSIVVLFIAFAVRFSLTLTDPMVNLMVSLPILAIMVMCILCFFIAAVECLQVGDNRKKDKENEEYMKKYK